jgi:hypothetical protein
MMNVRNAVLLVSVLALTGCVADSESAEPAVSAEEEPLLGGVASNSLPMVGLFSFTNMGDCTATMISRRYFVTAAHCIGYQPRLQSGVNGTATLTLTAVPGLGVLPVAQVFAFAGNPSKYTSFSCPFSMNPYCSTGVGEFDIALGQLAAPLPVSPNWTPAPMSSVEPVSNQVITLVGYGCNTRAMPAPPRSLCAPREAVALGRLQRRLPR